MFSFFYSTKQLTIQDNILLKIKAKETLLIMIHYAQRLNDFFSFFTEQPISQDNAATVCDIHELMIDDKITVDVNFQKPKWKQK